mmetsp:Transcript_69562/g.182360  ORF Transcript_69562/g.182360 Transcript_69562/m.182360 type:complete len:278 (+) Transcript_69562:716-1549(+)
MLLAVLYETGDDIPLRRGAVRELARLDLQDLVVERGVVESLLAALLEEVQPDELADADPLEVGREAAVQVPLRPLLVRGFGPPGGPLRVLVRRRASPGGEVHGTRVRLAHGAFRHRRRLLQLASGVRAIEGGRRRDGLGEGGQVQVVVAVQDNVIDRVVRPVRDRGEEGLRRARRRVVVAFDPKLHGAAGARLPLQRGVRDRVEETGEARVLRGDGRVRQREDVAWHEPGGVELLAEEAPLPDVEGPEVEPAELLAGLQPLQTVLYREGRLGPQSRH